MFLKTQTILQKAFEPKFAALRNLFLISYAISKDIVTFQRDVKNRFLLAIVKFLSVLGAVGFLIGMYIVISPFLLLYAITHGLLRCIYGNKYGGGLLGIDVLFEMKPSKTVFNVVLIFSCKEDSANLIEKLKRSACQMHQCNFKFGSRIKSLFGFRYYLKNQVEFEDVVEVRKYNDKEYMTRDDLLNYLEENCITLAKNQMWNCVLFSQPILWNTQSETNKQIAVTITLRHALADFPSIMGAIKKHFHLTEVTKKSASANSVDKIDLNLDNVRVLRNPLITRLDGAGFKIHGKSNWHVATFVEEKEEYIPKIKAIKQVLNCSFIELVSAVLSASVYDYAMKRKVKLKNFTIESVTRPSIEDVAAIVNASYNYDDLENHFGGVLFNIPFKSEDQSMKDRIAEIHRRNSVLPYCIDPFLVYSMYQYVGTYVPTMVVRAFTYIFAESMTIGISNVVGLPKCVCGENTVDDILFFAPDFLNLGFLFFIHSYAGRIQVSAVSRRGFIHERDDLQQIVNNAFKYIDQAEKEILSEHIP